MQITKSSRERNDIKDMVFEEFSRRQSIQRNITNKYDICKMRLGRFFSARLNALSPSASFNAK